MEKNYLLNAIIGDAAKIIMSRYYPTYDWNILLDERRTDYEFDETCQGVFLKVFNVYWKLTRMKIH